MSDRFTPEDLGKKGFVPDGKDGWKKAAGREAELIGFKPNDRQLFINPIVPKPNKILNAVKSEVNWVKFDSTIRIKPLSVNEAWKGKRYKTDKYKAYWTAVSLMLPNEIIVPDGLLRVYYEFGLSSMGGDWDNLIKPLQDILADKYKFNDNRIRSCGGVNLILVPKGEEYLKFKFESL